MARSKGPEAPANILFAHSYCLICRSHPLNESNWSVVCISHSAFVLFMRSNWFHWFYILLDFLSYSYLCSKAMDGPILFLFHRPYHVTSTPCFIWAVLLSDDHNTTEPSDVDHSSRKKGFGKTLPMGAKLMWWLTIELRQEPVVSVGLPAIAYQSICSDMLIMWHCS